MTELTDAELEAVASRNHRAMYDTQADHIDLKMSCKDVPLLIAEVRRLRAIIKPKPLPDDDLRYLIGNMDAHAWAAEFCLRNPSFDRDLAVAWFSNMIMAGYDTANNRADEKIRKLEAQVENMQNPLGEGRGYQVGYLRMALNVVATSEMVEWKRMEVAEDALAGTWEP